MISSISNYNVDTIGKHGQYTRRSWLVSVYRLHASVVYMSFSRRIYNIEDDARLSRLLPTVNKETVDVAWEINENDAHSE